tara:strand:- start:11 stop:238 length:228 start_codon:yes stop_codon:yes gene_type:complete
MNELKIGISLLIIAFALVAYLYNFIANQKLSKDDKNYIKAMEIIKNKYRNNKIEIQKAQQDIDNYLEYKKQTRNI